MGWSDHAGLRLVDAALIAVVGALLACPSETVAPECERACGGGGEGGSTADGGAGGAGGKEPACPLGAGEPLRAVSISVTFDSVAVLLSNGSVVCWGSDIDFHQCGGASHFLEPTLAKGPSCLVSAERGAPMGAGLTWDGRAQIWGPENANSAGDGAGPGPAFGQSAIVELPVEERVVWVSPSIPTVAITESGAVYMWGDSSYGISPSQIVELPEPTLYPLPEPAVMSGQDSHCILTERGNVYCYGTNRLGKLGLDDLENGGQFEPVRIDLEDVTWISEHSDYVCAVRSDGSAWCWGDNYQARTGQPWPEVLLHPEPLQVAGVPPLARVFTSGKATCATELDGRAWCWGETSTFGPDAYPPIRWRDDLRFVDIGIGEGFACGVVDDGRVYCKGNSGACYGPLPQGTDCFVDLSAVYTELGQP